MFDVRTEKTQHACDGAPPRLQQAILQNGCSMSDDGELDLAGKQVEISIVVARQAETLRVGGAENLATSARPKSPKPGWHNLCHQKSLLAGLKSCVSCGELLLQAHRGAKLTDAYNISSLSYNAGLGLLEPLEKSAGVRLEKMEV